MTSDLLELAKREAARIERGEPEPPPPRRPPSFIERTSQKWKVRVSDTFNFTGLAFFFGACWFREEAWIPGILMGTLLSGIGFAWSCLAIRCPECKTRVMWHSYNHRAAREAETWARFQLVCPRCGFDPPQQQAGGTATARGAQR